MIGTATRDMDRRRAGTRLAAVDRTPATVYGRPAAAPRPSTPEVDLMSFVQIIEYQSDQPDQVRKLADEWMRQLPSGGPNRVLMGEDREKPGHFVMVAEFENYELAMMYSNRPKTGSYAERMRDVCTTDPRYVNLDVQLQEG
ncbi:MAG TPA: hypothetical protein VGD43_17030 [Micromonospora sp.]